MLIISKSLLVGERILVSVTFRNFFFFVLFDCWWFRLVCYLDDDVVGHSLLRVKTEGVFGRNTENSMHSSWPNSLLHVSSLLLLQSSISL